PAALAVRGRRYASWRTSAALREATVVHTRAGSRAACAARRWRVGVTGGVLKGAPGLRPSPTCCPASPALQGGLWACVPPLPRDSAPRRLPRGPSQDPSLGATTAGFGAVSRYATMLSPSPRRLRSSGCDDTPNPWAEESPHRRLPLAWDYPRRGAT